MELYVCLMLVSCLLHFILANWLCATVLVLLAWGRSLDTKVHKTCQHQLLRLWMTRFPDKGVSQGQSKRVCQALKQCCLASKSLSYYYNNMFVEWLELNPRLLYQASPQAPSRLNLDVHYTGPYHSWRHLECSTERIKFEGFCPQWARPLWNRWPFKSPRFEYLNVLLFPTNFHCMI